MKKIHMTVLTPSNFKRTLFFLISDILITTFALYFSFILRFEFIFPLQYREIFIKALPIFIIFKLITFAVFRMYKITWRYVGLNDLWNTVNAIIVAEAILMALILIPLPHHLQLLPLPDFKGFPRSIFLIDGLISIFLIGGTRILKRLYLEVIAKKRYKKYGKRTIIIGAGNTGEMIIRDMARQDFSRFYPMGLLDDDRFKIGAYMYGTRILGAIDDLKDVVVKHDAEAVIIAIPSLNHKALKHIYNMAKNSGVSEIKVVPRIYDFHKPNINIKSLEDIHIEDLIGRQMVEINYTEIEGFLTGKVVLITGAGGSIGSEIAVQMCGFYPDRLILFEIDETDLNSLKLKLKRFFPGLIEKVHFIVGDIRDIGRIDEVFKTFMPDVVFHAAAYKHVPMMEYNSGEAVKVNIFGTYNLSQASVKYGVKRFIMISTDKAVMPVSIMGSTKRMAENICKAFNEGQGARGNEQRNTEFISVRFGNVLGSRGSVVPLFMEQLKYGGPLTITHRDMQRYFMTIPEAVSLVLQASIIGRGGEVLVLDMGEPIKVVEMAEELIKIHGLEPYKDIDIEFIGLRPGEKLFEEILTAEEGTVATRHEKVFRAKNSERYSIDEIQGMLNEFDVRMKEFQIDNNERIKELLKRYVKHFNPRHE